VSEPTLRRPPSANRQAFTRLYAAASAAVQEFASTLPPEEARWYRFVAERSDAEFLSWDSKRFLDRYLDTAGRIRIRAVGVLAHVYIHVAWDFPRFLADSFPMYPELSRERRYRAYVQGSAHVFRNILDQSKKPSIMGLLGLVMRTLPGDRPAARLAGGWFLAHRCAAWTVGEMLADSADRPALEARLWQGIDEAAGRIRGLSLFQWAQKLPLASDLVLDRSASSVG
jgi:hypothetical protein